MLLLRKADRTRTDAYSQESRGMSIDPRDASAARSEPFPAQEELPVREPSPEIGEGLGVFRALLLMLILYLAAGFLLWFAWHAWRHWASR